MNKRIIWTNATRELLILALILGLGVGLSGCGVEGSGTSTGNPIIQTAGTVALVSPAYTPSAQKSLSGSLGLSLFSVSTVTDFKFCVTKLKMKNEKEQQIENSSGQSSIEVALGAIDLSNSSSSKAWGAVEIPVGFTLGRLEVEIHKDAEKCGGSPYSLSFNGSQITKDLEFRFAFTNGVALEAGATLNLAMDTIAGTLLTIYNQGQLTDEQVGGAVQSAFDGKGSKKED